MEHYKKDYPRPQFAREQWENLNGEWDFAFDDSKRGVTEKWYRTFPEGKKIVVPFTYETKMSGIGDETKHEAVWYRRIIQVEGEKLKGQKLMLHLEGCDYHTIVWVNGEKAGSHRGCYSRFSFDISHLVAEGENEIVICARDSFSTEQPRGKQRWKKENYECWYVQTTGIWKTVWTEYVPITNLKAVKLTPVYQDNALDIVYELETQNYGSHIMIEADITFRGEPVNKVCVAGVASKIPVTVSVADPEEYDHHRRDWTVERPNLFEIHFKVLEEGKTVDEVFSYFGMREIRIEEGNILLNGNPLYQRLILDQGYWKDSHLTPPSEEALIEDIEKIKALGYNGLRKHQKVEDERFLYWCDVMGMLVWSEVGAAYQFTDQAVENFTREWMEIVRQNYNHPSIITWTPFNESWGIGQVETDEKQQHFTEAIYYLTKSFDAQRPVIVNDGWEHTISDIITLHDYEERGDVFFDRYQNGMDDILQNIIYHNGGKSALANGYTYDGQPILISEYGGIAFQNEESGWGYGNKVKTEDEFLKRFDAITTAIKDIPRICGFCYTQVTDVQQEINGLMDIDRNFKIAPERIKEINERHLR